MNYERLAAMEGRPLNFGPILRPSAYAQRTGPCGDTVKIWLKIKNNTIHKASFVSDGCEDSWICCSTAAYMIEGMQLEEVASLTQEKILDKTPPIRNDHRHCALLAADTIKQAIATYDPKPVRVPLSRRIKTFFVKEQNGA
jgi:nitrogen fixation NifU-like protein